MAGSDRATVRVIALGALLLAAGATTRGYLPGAPPEQRRMSAASTLEPIVLAALLAVSGTIIAVAVVHRARHQRVGPGSVGQLSLTAGARGGPVWRAVLIVAAALVLWLLTVLMLAKLGGGLRVELATEVPGTGETPPGTPGAPAAPPPGAPGGLAGGGPVYLLTVATLLALLATAVVAARARRPQYTATEASVIPAADEPDAGENLVRAAELGLARIVDPSREPRAAIIACYAVMERHLGAVPDIAPRAFDTPTEVLARAVEHHALPAANATRLVELFTEARFSAHLMSEHDRADAIAALQQVLQELRNQR
ncbi:DUF4129 domain-containing protein [Mycobacterium sp. UM_Kg27]|uniref:DUF4129 domain-containing protein n=1 Tax=Mycobacterium sp. UM_Kg27 TaxID=1545693 RepID=UPI00061AA144|nr:DUF4129 domain-containing protein [Mycobacterium sp. UM_Kg27]